MRNQGGRREEKRQPFFLPPHSPSQPPTRLWSQILTSPLKFICKRSKKRRERGTEKKRMALEKLSVVGPKIAFRNRTVSLHQSLAVGSKGVSAPFPLWPWQQQEVRKWDSPLGVNNNKKVIEKPNKDRQSHIKDSKSPGPSPTSGFTVAVNIRKAWENPLCQGWAVWKLCCSVAKSGPTLCDPKDYRVPGFPGPSPSPGVCSNSCPLSWWCHPTVSSSITPAPQSFLGSLQVSENCRRSWSLLLLKSTDTQEGFLISIQPASLTLKTNQTLIPFPNSVTEAGFWRWHPSYQGVQIVLQSCLSGPKSLGNLEPWKKCTRATLLGVVVVPEGKGAGLGGQSGIARFWLRTKPHHESSFFWRLKINSQLITTEKEQALQWL